MHRINDHKHYPFLCFFVPVCCFEGTNCLSWRKKGVKNDPYYSTIRRIRPRLTIARKDNDYYLCAYPNIPRVVVREARVLLSRQPATWNAFKNGFRKRWLPHLTPNMHTECGKTHLKMDAVDCLVSGRPKPMMCVELFIRHMKAVFERNKIK